MMIPLLKRMIVHSYTKLPQHRKTMQHIKLLGKSAKTPILKFD